MNIVFMPRLANYSRSAFATNSDPSFERKNIGGLTSLGLGRCHCEGRTYETTRQARRFETPSLAQTWSTMMLRREGVRCFPRRPF
jgi:hypothetical protein